jgi:hypothetical protein
MNKTESKSLSGPIELLKKAWSEYKANVKVFTLILIIPAFLELLLKYILVFVFKPASQDTASSFFPFLLIMLFGFLLVYIFILFWSNTALYLSVVEKYSDWKGSYHKSLNKIIPLLFINVLIAVLVSAGLILFIIPGIILYVWLSLATFVYFDQHKGGFNALAKSKDYIKGYWWSVFLRGLFIFFVYFIITILFGVLTEALKMPFSQSIIGIVLTPIALLYNFELYRELKAIHSHPHHQD